MAEAGTLPAERTRPERLRASAPLHYPFEPPAADASVVEVAPGILWARIAMPIALDHINVYLLQDGDGWTVVDTGLHTEATRQTWEQLAARHLQGLPIRRLVCTHSHYDHAGQAAWMVERFGAELWMSFGEYYMLRGFYGPPPEPLPAHTLRFYQRAGMAGEQIERVFASLRRDPFMPPVPDSFVRLRHGDRLRIGARDWQVIVGEGHSPEHVCLYDAQDRILIAGDQLLPRITSNVLVMPVEPEADPLRLWLASLERLAPLAADTLVLPSHQGVFRGLRERVQELQEHHRQQLDLLRAALRQKKRASAWELMQVQFPKRRHPMDDLMAIGETLAHLSWLRHQGQVSRTLGDDGAHCFELTRPTGAREAPDTETQA
ncbi:MBL fold metallo-hydrolase [Comamonas faecalis]|uniref:MBL fold metallo-hydrolase n=1 Tax=Comamonas faecalis TaxID=1387849 RepID=A0ABP7RDS3_9BURK